MSTANMSQQEENPDDIKYFGKLKTFDFSFVKDCEEKLDVVPMEIDKSVADTDESSVEVLDGENKLRKRRRVKKEEQDLGNPRKILKGDEDAQVPRKFWLAKFLFIFVILPVFSYVSFAHNADLSLKDNFRVVTTNIFKQRDKCNDSLDVAKIVTTMKQNLYGQDDSLDYLSRNMYTKTFKALIFAGPTGVGKSYAVELLKNAFIWSRNVFDIYYPIDENDIKVLKLTLSSCGYNLIVLDGLEGKTPRGVYDTMRNIQQYCYENKLKTLVVLVYNTQDLTTDLKPVYIDTKNILLGFQNEFKNALDVSLIQFNKLSLDNVMSCVASEAVKLNIKITQDEALKIAKEIPHFYGCKGARAKLMILRSDEDL